MASATGMPAPTSSQQTSSSTSSTNGHEQMFTVEQIELIRRLRNSGMSKDQILSAWDILDRVDSQLGQVYNIPVSYANQLQAAVTLMGVQNAIHSTLQQQQAQQLQQQHILDASNARQMRKRSAENANLTPTDNLVTSATSQTINEQPKAFSRGANNESQPELNISNSNGASSSETSQSNQSEISNLLQPQAMTAQQQMQQMLQLQQMAQISNEEFENSQELKEFLAQGEIKCCEEIKNFVVKHNIKQHQIASLAGLSQSYISRYFRGDPVEMSLRSRRAIYKWYLTFKDFPEAIGPAVSMTLLTGTPPTKNMLGPLEAQASQQQSPSEFTYPKRERFVFRPCHIEVLERSYEADNYPSIEKREEIARTCNATLESMAGRAVTDREKVTTQTVTNWFANRRKEMKKIAREDSDSLVKQRVRSKLPSFSGNGSDSITNSPQQVTNYSSEDTVTEKPSSGKSQELTKEQEEEMKQRVEFAAVNQAILALSGTAPIILKSEGNDESEMELSSENLKNLVENDSENREI